MPVCRLSLAVLVALVVGGCRRHEAAPDRPKPAPVEQNRIATPLEVAETIYDGKLSPGWDDWGWGPHELGKGPAMIGMSGFGGWILHHADLTSSYGGVAFRFRAPPEYGDFLQVALQYRQVDDKTLPAISVGKKDIALLPDGWSEVFIPWNALNPSRSPFDRVTLHAYRMVPTAPIAIDKIVLTKPGAGSVATSSGPARPVRMTIECARAGHRISPLIYGYAADEWDTFASAKRMGGNTLTRLNWDIGNVWNTGSDWYFENVSGQSKLPEWIEGVFKKGVPIALVVPMIGWVAKDATSMGFPISKLGPQRAHDPYRTDAGDGYGVNGKPIKPGPPTETSVAAPPEVIERWVRKLREDDGPRGKHAVNMYILDNEPALWSTTHRDVHPDPVSYDELLDRTIKYGSAIRRAAPDALIAGPAEWGWTGYFYSAKDVADGFIPHADQLLHGGKAILPWYLGKLADYEKETGIHILDVVDVHYYPQAKGVWGGGAAIDKAGAALRLRSTRALWDPTYVDESWINDRVRLIPRLKEWIAENYPGRGISIGEWSFGAEEHISGGLAIAEVLGRFGQQGLTSAYYWLGPKANTPGSVGFRTFRNYDGNGARFLDWSIPTRETQPVSLFASRDETGAHVTAVLLNLSADDAIQANVDVSQCGRVTARRYFSYDGSTPGLVSKPATDGDPHGVSTRLEPYSVQVLELSVQK